MDEFKVEYFGVAKLLENFCSDDELERTEGRDKTIKYKELDIAYNVFRNDLDATKNKYPLSIEFI